MSNRIIPASTSLALALTTLTTLTTPALSASPAAAEASGGLEEVVVTAQKREQNLQDVGIAVTALGGEALQRLGFSGSTDIAQQVPSLQFQSTTTFSTFSIRGVSQAEFTDQHELPVAVVVDGVYISSPGAVQTQLFDLDRVEVLRGPQGTLFGRNSTGGLVHFISKKPSDTLDGYANLTLGSYNQRKFDAAIGGPISGDTLTGRIAVAADDHDGYLENRNGPDVLAARVYSARGQLQYKPDASLRVLLKAQISVNDKERSGGYTWAPAAPGPDGLGVRIGPNDNPWGTCNGCDLLGYRNPSTDPYDQSFDTPGYFDRTASEGSATIEWDNALGTLTSVTDYYSHDKDYLEDTDASPNPLFAYVTSHQLRQFSQELRLSNSSNDVFWVGGLYYLNISSRFYQSLAFNFGPGVDLFGYDRRTDDTESLAAFGHVEFPVSDTLRLVTGARWTDDRKKLDGEAVDPFGAGIPVLLNRAQLGSAVDVSYGNWQAKAQVEWRPAPETLYFVGVSRGTKAGGFQGRMDPANLTFDQEVLTNYEGGFKITALNDSLRLNGSVFYYDYKDYQAFEFNQTSLATTIQNLPARVKGAELELYARPARPLEIGLGVSVLDTVAKGVVLPGGAIVDRDMPQSPGVSVNGLARYTVPVRSGSVALQVDFKYNGGYYFTVNNAPVEREPAYTIGNVRLSYESADGRWSAGAFVTNVLDKEYRVYSLDVSGLGFSNDRPGVPRWFGINVGYRLGAP